MKLMWIGKTKDGIPIELDVTELVTNKWFLNPRRDYVHKACFAHHSRTSTIGRLDQLRILGALRQHAAFVNDNDGHHDHTLQRAIDFLDNNRNPIVAESQLT